MEEVRRVGAAHKIVGDSIRATTALNTTAATATIGINFLIEPIPEMRKLITGPAIAAIDTPKIANPRIVARDELFSSVSTRKYLCVAPNSEAKDRLQRNPPDAVDRVAALDELSEAAPAAQGETRRIP